MAQIEIRPVGKEERPAWEPLWMGYLAFYKATLPPEQHDLTWARLHDPAEPMYLIGAYVDGKLEGIVHYLFHRSTWMKGEHCYLQDLFVAEGGRNHGLGRALIEAVYAKARESGSGRVYWLTHESTAVARGLYDKLAENAGFIQYRRTP